ncbi:WD40 repeat-like protein [Aureobasidium pullulans]|uniref:WD40 repeat-like protein n=1 Tax=Aureobasidium pullulans TaxID=5580 RepID=A0A4T0E0P4_AURPU|nr:WD40 repeat-like protein [Aureobasidium pullulans]
MAQRGRVVIDLSEDSPPPPELESHKAQPAKVPDTRFITPSDDDNDDDSDDGVMFLWGTRKQRHDTNVSNTLKSNLPTNVLDGKKDVTKPAPTQPNISRPLGPLPNAQKPTQSSLVPPRSSFVPSLQQQPRPHSQPQPQSQSGPAPQNQTQPRPQPWPAAPPDGRESSVSIANPSTKLFLASLSRSRATPSASIPQQLNLPPGATPLPSTSSIPPAHSHFQLPPQFSRPSRPSSAHAGLDSQAHAPPPGSPGKSMGLAPSQPVELFQLSPAPAPAIPALKHPALPPTLPSRVASDPPPTVLPEEISRGRNGDTSAEHARNNNLSQSIGLKPAPAAPSSSKHVSRTLASLSYPSEPRQPRKKSEAAPTSSKTSTSLVTQPPEPSQKRTLPAQQQATLPLKPAVNNAVDPGSPFSDDSFVTAVGSSSSVASKPASKSSPRIGKRKMEVIEIDDDEPLKRLRRTRSSAARPKSPGVLVQPDSVMGSVEVDTHDQFTFPRDITKIKPFKNRFGQPFTLEEDALVRHLKEVKKIPWKDFERFFPGRKWPSMQSRYSKVLSKLTVRPSGLVPLSLPASTREKPQREIPRPTREVLRPARELRGTHHVHTNSVDSFATRQTAEDETMDDPYRCRRVTQPLNYLIRHREIGATRGRQWPRKIHAGFKNLAYNSMGVQAHMDNASGDVSTVAWSPDGKFFAAGAVAVADRQTIDHSKPRNLVIGSAATQTAKELPQHTIKHMLPDGRQKDAFATVQLVAWSPDSKHMYSVGIDRRLHRYKVGESPLETTLVDTVEHPASVDFLSVSNNGLVATGCASADAGAIRVLAYDDENATSKAVRLSGTVQSRKTPSALKWGTAHNHQNYLLAGFSREVEVRYAEDDNRDKEGEVALWDMNTQQRLETDASNKNIFDLAWNPNPSSSSSIFAVASGTFGHVSHGIESVVRLYSPRQNRAQHTMELDCPAWDINDVIYSPHDSNLIAVGSTEGRVYIWDVRYTKHGQSPLSTLRHEETVAVEMDTGIRFLSWGSERNRLYSGSSDGVVKCWDPYRHDSDKEVRDVVRLSSSVMSGAFSPDFSHLLLGEAGARLNLLSVGKDGARFDQRTTPRFKVDEAPLKEEAASGALDCQKMFDTEALEIKPAGTMPFRQVVQGPNYNGPYRSDSEAVKLREKAGKFQEKVLRSLRRRNKQTRKSGYQDTEACSLDCGFIPLPDDYDTPEKWLSERIPDDIWDWIRAKGPMAEFACFRCGKAATITSRARTIECVACGTTWKTGALGYEVIEQTKTGVSGFKSEEEETESVDDLCDSEDEVERFRELSIDSDT